ncbi:hypothetical protein TMatcc_008529 [Talaromyces marneffei ATCC 18224]|uniref:uncharacterized protein n=1 Tax=Talaromyces marneffei TaxID=37727 RepID=UPI0012A8CC78|nr:uncharacterized protein EYB26_007862 [Talaromyces marneffei]QGA20161.1 hypothetical protein EYB26_007862 [Talaromyces marneffei]
MAFAGIVFTVYPDYPRSPRSAQWLTPREQEFIEKRLADNTPRTDDSLFSWRKAIDTIRDVRLWSFMLAQDPRGDICCLCAGDHVVGVSGNSVLGMEDFFAQGDNGDGFRNELAVWGWTTRWCYWAADF